jgi:hypothetical protein
VKLFTVIRKRRDDYFLVTPVEMVGITVDDAPFVAVDFVQLDGCGLKPTLKRRTKTHKDTDNFVTAQVCRST